MSDLRQFLLQAATATRPLLPISHDEQGDQDQQELNKSNGALMTPGNLHNLKKYLMLKRNNYRLRYYAAGHLQELQVKGVPVDRIDHMIGAHRVWSMDKQGNLIQSKFVIEEDYRAYLYSSLYQKNEARQVCLLNISQAINRRLCISTHPDHGTGIITYCIVDIPPKDYKYIRGVFCHVGLENHPSRAGYIILFKDDPNAFQPDTIPEEQVEGFVAGDKKLLKMWKRLQIWNGSVEE